MALVTTRNGRKWLRKAKSLMFVPYVYDDTIKDYVLGSQVYDVSAIIGDTISLEQDDGDTEEKYNEYHSNPIVSNNIIGDWKFTAECLDLQNAVLRLLLNAAIGYSADEQDEVSGAVAMPSEYSTIYVLARIEFHDRQSPVVVIPKMLLNSRVLLSELRGNGSKSIISGVAKYKNVAIQDVESGYLMRFVGAGYNNAFIVNTPVLFVPSGRTFMVEKYDDGTNHVFNSVSFNNGEISAYDVTITENSGTYALHTQSQQQ